MIHPLNQYFDQIFVISIDRNKKRLESFLQKHKDLNIEVFKGVDGKEIYPEIEYVSMFPPSFFLENNLAYERASFWNKGQLGCAMSHYALQKEIVKRELGRTLILEDDAIIVERYAQLFIRACNEIPENWELFYLGYNPISKWSENIITRQILKIKHLMFPVITEGMSSGIIEKRFFAESFSSILNKPGIYGGTHAYALSFAGAKKLVSFDTPLKYGFDTSLMFLNYHKLIDGYSIKKRIFLSDLNYISSLHN